MRHHCATVNEVAIVSILLGGVLVCSRGCLLVAPAATLRWFEGIVATNARTRAFGAVVLALGGTMAWAGNSESSGLAAFLLVCGWVIVGIGLVALVLFPGIYRAIAEGMLPASRTGGLAAWRALGLLGVVAGGFFIYFGVLAL